MKHDKTFVILTPGFPKDESDSTCLPMQQQLVAALKNNTEYNVVVLTFQYPYQRQTYQWHGIKVMPFDGRNRGGISRIINRRKIITALRKIHSQRPVAGLFSFWYGECAAVGKIFGDRYNIPYYCWLLGQDVKKNNKYPARVRLDTNRLVAISDTAAAEFEENHEIKPGHIIPPGIDTKLFRDNNNDRTIDVLGVGSLIPLKNYETFVSAIAALKKNNPGVKAELVGKGPERKNLQDLVIAHELEDNVKLTGELDYPDVLQKMQKARVFLHPSTTEGFPGVCVEALYAGAYVVSFCKPMDVDFPHWHVVDSPEQMISKAAQILDQPADYRSILIATIEDTAKRILQLFP